MVMAVMLCILCIQMLAWGQSPRSSARPDRGTRPNGAYSVSDLENINLTNGNLSLSIPLAGMPPIAGGKLSPALGLTYNSKIWDVKRDEARTDGRAARIQVC